MKSSITIIHQTLSYPSEIVRLPVRYEVEEDLLIQAPMVYCAIDIPREHIPAWLNPVPMDTTYFCQEGMHMILYNIGELRNREAIEFCKKLYLSIMQRERLTENYAGNAAPSLMLSAGSMTQA